MTSVTHSIFRSKDRNFDLGSFCEGEARKIFLTKKARSTSSSEPSQYGDRSRQMKSRREAPPASPLHAKSGLDDSRKLDGDSAWRMARKSFCQRPKDSFRRGQAQLIIAAILISRFCLLCD
jgi:hypothetical protein